MPVYFSGSYNTIFLSQGGNLYLGSAVTVNDFNPAVISYTFGVSMNGYSNLHLDGTIVAEVQNAVIGTGDRNTIYVGATGKIDALFSSAVDMSSVDRFSLFNQGQIAAQVVAVRIDAITGAQISTVENSGTITSTNNSAIASLGTNGLSVSNHGTIFGGTSGINCYGYLILTNTGRIEGSNASVLADNSSDSISNSGTMIGAINLFDGTDILRNRGGEIEGSVDMGSGGDRLDNRGGIIQSFAPLTVNTGAGADRVLNRDGVISGDVFLGVDADIMDNRGGLVDGIQYGEEGADTFFVSALGGDTIDGGADFDSLNYQFGSTVVLALDGSFDNSGGALGDVITGIERVYGSISGNDRIRGDGNINHLYGMSGNDRLDAAGGSDTLVGGIGADTVTGGLGNDTFIFFSLDEAADVITDFSTVDDRIRVYAAGFGGGLVAGTSATASNFLSRADNLAQDLNDRFIFRTTDQTLWFDVDGKGGAGPVLLADLQPGAVVMAVDILIA